MWAKIKVWSTSTWRVNSARHLRTKHTMLKDEVILHGPQGRIIKAKTTNQHKLVEHHDERFGLLLDPQAGKTYTAAALAVAALKNREVRRIIMTRLVEAGENLVSFLGFKGKIRSYLQPLYDALRDMIPREKLEFYLENKTIEIAPLAFMRGEPWTTLMWF